MTDFPSSGSFIKQVRGSCRTAREQAGIKISVDAIDKLLTTTLNETDFNRLKSQHGVSSFPLNFPTLESEINFLAVLSLLNTLSGYRLPLHKATGDGAYQNIIKILLGLFIAGDDSLSAQGLSKLTADQVAGIMGVSLFSERPHESLPGVTVGTKGGDVAEAVDLVVQACNETGKALIESGHKNLGALVLEILDESDSIIKEKDELAGADHFIQRLVTAIPGFADQTTLTTITPSQPVYVYKKAFFLLFSLYQRLDLRARNINADSPHQRTVPSADTIPMFIDNVLCTMLVHLEVVDLSECTVPALKAWHASAQEFRDKVQGKSSDELASVPKHVDGPRVNAQEAYTVRASALDAGRVILERIQELKTKEGLEWLSTVNEADVDGYLWSVAKDDPVLRKVPRMVERNTIMY